MSDKEQAFNRYQNESSADTIARLERELAAARRDAERYRHLKMHMRAEFDTRQPGEPQLVWTQRGSGVVFNLMGAGDRLDAAIDAALGSPGEPAAPDA